jgi:P4 family phage/plasmid primase-like protien
MKSKINDPMKGTAQTTRKLDAIRAYRAAGFCLFPCIGKVPARARVDWRKTTLDQYSEAELTQDNYGVVIPDGIVLVDVDVQNFFAVAPDGTLVRRCRINPDKTRAMLPEAEGLPVDKPLSRLVAAVGPMAETFRQRTGQGGVHIPLRVPKGSVFVGKLKAYPGIDVKGLGGYFVGAGSIHPITGKAYEITCGSPSQIMDAPRALFDFIERKETAVSSSGTDGFVDDEATREQYVDYLLRRAEPAIQGQGGNRQAFKVAARGRDGALPPQVTLDLMLEHWNGSCQPPWAAHELQAVVKNAYTYASGAVGSSHPAADFEPVAVVSPIAPDPFSEEAGVSGVKPFRPAVLADAIRKIEDFLAFPVDESGRAVKLWHYKDGVYHPDGENIAREIADRQLAKLSKNERLNDVVEMVKERSKMSEDELNPNALTLINCRNGMLNWETGELHGHSPALRSTFQINAAYNPAAKSEAVDRFLTDVFPSDALPLSDEILGYVMVPVTKHQKAFMFLGSGANGKSTWFEMFEAFLGRRNVSHVSLQDLVGNRFVIPMLQGKLANIYADIPHTGLEQSDIFKAIVAGDTIKAEQKFARPFDFKPKARLLFSANELPRSRDLTPAYFRRWVIIPFPNTFEGSKAKRNLLEALTSDAARSALLNRALVGLRRLEQKQGFTECRTVTEAGQQYRRQCDSAFEFISERLEVDFLSSVGKTEAYERYVRWAIGSGLLHPVSQMVFNRRVMDVLKTSEVRESNVRVWSSVGWRPGVFS